MLRKAFRLFTSFFVLTLLIAAQACSVFGRSNTTPTPLKVPAFVNSATPTSISPVPTSGATLTPIPTPTVELIPTRTPPAVTITATNGNLAIRKGPDVVFDAIATLNDGESARAVARSILDGWIEIPIPSQPDEMGWVSTKTDYSVVVGDVLDLPMIRTVEWPTGAYLRNCTAHQMLVQPGDISLPSVNDSPNNRVWFPPGLYTVYDQEVDGHPDVLHVKLWPQYSIDVVKDGDGVKSTCP